MSVLHDWITLIICRNKKECDVVSSSLPLLPLLLLFYNNQLFHNWMDICVVRCAFIWFFDRIIMVIFLCKKIHSILTFCIVNFVRCFAWFAFYLSDTHHFLWESKEKRKNQFTMNHLTLCLLQHTAILPLNFVFSFHIQNEALVCVCVCIMNEKTGDIKCNSSQKNIYIACKRRLKCIEMNSFQKKKIV